MTPAVGALKLSVSDKVAAVIGATGLVGRELVRTLSEHGAYREVVAFSRGTPGERREGKLRWLPFPELGETGGEPGSATRQADLAAACASVLPRGNDFFSCLGTTRRDAGSARAFRFVDLELNRAFATAALERGYAQFAIVSAANADPSSFLLYPRTKGELDLALTVLPFWAVHIMRPGVLRGERERVRWLERAAARTLGWFRPADPAALPRWQAIDAASVAEAMAAAAQGVGRGHFTYYNADIAALARGAGIVKQP